MTETYPPAPDPEGPQDPDAPAPSDPATEADDAHEDDVVESPATEEGGGDSGS